jgi:hypothetical protein
MSFEERILSVMREAGPDVPALRVAGRLADDGEHWFGPTLARVQIVLEQLSLEGVIDRRDVPDDHGYVRPVYSLGAGRRD